MFRQCLARAASLLGNVGLGRIYLVAQFCAAGIKQQLNNLRFQEIKTDGVVPLDHDLYMFV